MEHTGTKYPKSEESFRKFKFKRINKLIRMREIGLSTNVFQGPLLRAANNPHSDFDFLRTLLCDNDAYLETIACRKIPRWRAPAYCQGRLFTENYQTWFNLFTGPSSGPLLMTSDLFGRNTNRDSEQATSAHVDRPKVIDIACVTHPHTCKPPSNRKWIGPNVILLTKSGWLYEADVNSGEILSEIFIPTREYASNLNCYDENQQSKGKQHSGLVNRIYKYHYITINRDSDSMVIKSSHSYCSQDQVSSDAFCIFRLYPLRLHCHFLVTVKSPSPTPSIVCDIFSDMFIVNANKASNICFYGLKEIIKEYDLGCNLSLKQKVNVPTPSGLHEFRQGVVGDASLGIPFTMSNVELSSSKVQLKAPCLFKTAAMKHCLQIGGPPYHYIVPTNKNGTMWALRHLCDGTEVSTGKLKVDCKWDSSHWHALRFSSDDTGRLLRQCSSSLEVLSILHSEANEEDSKLTSSKKKGKLSAVRKVSSNCKVLSDFIIDLQPNLQPNLQQSDDLEWQYPSNALVPPLPPHSVSARGRPIRRPRPWYSFSDSAARNSDEEEIHTLMSVEYDYELNLLVLVHYRPSADSFHPGWEFDEGRAELVVSLFDNYYGGHLTTFVLEKDTSPSDRDVVSVVLDEDTFMYTRLRANDNRLQYKILRLNRKYGSRTSFNS